MHSELIGLGNSVATQSLPAYSSIASARTQPRRYPANGLLLVVALKPTRPDIPVTNCVMVILQLKRFLGWVG